MKLESKTFGTLILLAVAAVFLIVAQPILVIWALNTIFPTLSIAYTAETWLAVSALSLMYFTAKR